MAVQQLVRANPVRITAERSKRSLGHVREPSQKPGQGPAGALPLESIFDRLDHLVVATPDLAGTIREVGELLGVMPSEGGRHPQELALLALGPRMYLEVMGPDDDRPDQSQPPPFDIESLDRPRLVTWVCRAERLDEVVEQARRLGIELGSIQPGSRRRPDGSTLTWTMTDLTMPREGGIVPYFINWGDSGHPAQSAPIGCSLERVWAEHPEPSRVKRILVSLGLDLPIDLGDQPRLLAKIAGPRGTIEFG
jgi:hypothetical protein